jgi:hypothetical protein
VPKSLAANSLIQGPHTLTDVVIDEIISSESKLSVIVKAYEVNGTDEDWKVTAYAICATTP